MMCVSVSVDVCALCGFWVHCVGGSVPFLRFLWVMVYLDVFLRERERREKRDERREKREERREERQRQS